MRLTPGGVATQSSQNRLVPSGDTFSWSRSTRRNEANWIDGTFVEDSRGDAATSAGEYVSGLAWSRPVASTADCPLPFLFGRFEWLERAAY